MHQAQHNPPHRTSHTTIRNPHTAHHTTPPDHYYAPTHTTHFTSKHLTPHQHKNHTTHLTTTPHHHTPHTTPTPSSHKRLYHHQVGYGPDGTLEGANQGQVRRWGTGGPGYNIPAEFNERPHEFGVLSMARSSDPNSAGSQFFVCLGTLPSLDRKYTTFGKLLSGESTLRKIAGARTVKGDIPFTRQGIEKAQVL